MNIKNTAQDETQATLARVKDMLDRQGQPFDFLGWFEDTLLELAEWG